ncbi:MAG: hypothetical protein DMF44_13985, partial [Verrucomicrobia bacterium]
TVHHAHEHGILHRDIKPGNILLDAKGEPHLTDFGLARLPETESTVTRTMEVLGTPSYMAPEQAVGNNPSVTRATDIYGLGAVLYQLLTGHAPFAGGTTFETVRLVLDTEPRQPRLLNPKVDRDLNTICLKCLDKDPQRRYCSALALAEDLEHWQKHEPIRARRAGLVTRGRKWVRRNPSITVMAAMLLVLAVPLGVMIWKNESERSAASNPAPSEKSIAVLPFENLSRDPDNAFFADGVQDEILTNLAKIADLKVISRTSVMQYKSGIARNLRQIARELGVANILEGSAQKSGDAVRVNVQLIKAADGSHLWADTFDHKLTDIFSVESEVAKAVAEQLRAKLTGQEKQIIAAKPTDNVEAYDAYLRGLAYIRNASDDLAAQKYLREAVRLDPKFALGWALLSWFDAAAYRATNLPQTAALREEARQAAENAFALQPNLGEAVLAKGFYHYACLRDYDTAVPYFEQARQLLPNSSLVLESMAFLERRRGHWDRSDSYFNEAERLDPRNAELLGGHAINYYLLRRFPEALRKFDEVLNITRDNVETVALKAVVAQAEGDLPRAAALLAPLHPDANNPAFGIQAYQAILERRSAQIIPRLKEMLVKPDPVSGRGEQRFWLGWAQEVAGDTAGAEETWRQARSELEFSLYEQPENDQLMGYLALTNAALGDKGAAFKLVERAMDMSPIEKDAFLGPCAIEILARVAAQMGEPDRAIAALEKLLSIPYGGALGMSAPLTPALLRLDPMFDPLRDNPRFQKLVASSTPK